MTGPPAPAGWRGTVAFVTANTFEYDSRHRRAAAALAVDGWHVVVVAMHAPHLPEEELLPDGVVVRRPFVERRILSVVPAPIRRVIGFLVGLRPDAERLPVSGRGSGGTSGRIARGLEILAYRRRIDPWTKAAVAAAPGARIFVCKALVALPVIARAAARTGAKYVYDIADLHVESGRLASMPGPSKRYHRRQEARLLRAAAARIAATPAMATAIAFRHEVDRPVVVMNARERWRPHEAAPRPPHLREAAGLPAEREIVLYQGAFRLDQGIELLIAALDEPALAARPLTAVFLGFGLLEERLHAEASARPGRIVVLPPVPSDELLAWTAGADVAFVGTPPVTENQRLTAPNKLFEAVMAGVPAVVAEGTWTARLVEAERLGTVVSPWTPAGLARGIVELLERPADVRREQRVAIRRAALERLNWEVEGARLVDLFRNLG